MAGLTLRCMTTDQKISTGIVVDQEGFTRLANPIAKARGRHCGRLHGWWTRGTRMCGIEPSQSNAFGGVSQRRPDVGQPLLEEPRL